MRSEAGFQLTMRPSVSRPTIESAEDSTMADSRRTSSSSTSSESISREWPTSATTRPPSWTGEIVVTTRRGRPFLWRPLSLPDHGRPANTASDTPIRRQSAASRSSSTVRPNASCSAQPNMACAAGFHPRMTFSGSVVMIAALVPASVSSAETAVTPDPLSSHGCLAHRPSKPVSAHHGENFTRPADLIGTGTSGTSGLVVRAVRGEWR